MVRLLLLHGGRVNIGILRGFNPTMVRLLHSSVN